MKLDSRRFVRAAFFFFLSGAAGLLAQSVWVWVAGIGLTGTYLIGTSAQMSRLRARLAEAAARPVSLRRRPPRATWKQRVDGSLSLFVKGNRIAEQGWDCHVTHHKLRARFKESVILNAWGLDMVEARYPAQFSEAKNLPLPDGAYLVQWMKDQNDSLTEFARCRLRVSNGIAGGKAEEQDWVTRVLLQGNDHHLMIRSTRGQHVHGFKCEISSDSAPSGSYTADEGFKGSAFFGDKWHLPPETDSGGFHFPDDFKGAPPVEAWPRGSYKLAWYAWESTPEGGYRPYEVARGKITILEGGLVV